MSERDTGGPAFGQVIELRCVRVDPTGETEWEPEALADGGLTVRDYFASHAHVDHEVSVPYVEKFMGRSIPSWNDQPAENASFWAEYRARMRYIDADAMLAARKA